MKKFRLVATPLNNKGIPLYYEYIISGDLSPNEDVTVTQIQMQNNLLLHGQQFEITQIGPDGNMLVSNLHNKILLLSTINNTIYRELGSEQLCS